MHNSEGCGNTVQNNKIRSLIFIYCFNYANFYIFHCFKSKRKKKEKMKNPRKKTQEKKKTSDIGRET